ncbi:class I SAM-dependent methyltransferase [Merismopedia glauca]|uniref:Class I SAM-dependent methyltransferase n=1 Tax=Merismopedia glauca CCAP 1448/3 TaxID=1296344 RepID=A0A2T1BZ66_9CYAN|nr:class I SAM-dependent methyltransferase [Merismopedia glauca]PSB01244.1 class I SAM-dependent methyltransferase [Merismopedia glauca CCAP 1448/3]
MISIDDFFSTTEFDFWADKDGLIFPEKFLIEKYLDPQKTTLEAGTGGGRILLAMQELGFQALSGFDYLSAFIDRAKQRDISGNIDFSVQDAINLKYADRSFGQIIYLQQFICFLEGQETVLKALQEASRVLQPGGKALFSVVSLDVRKRSWIHRLYISYISILRKLRTSNRSIQYLPWLTIEGHKFNFNSLIDGGPQAYWFRISELAQMLSSVNLQIIAIGSNYQINQGKMCSHLDELPKEPLKGILYVVCCKQNE